MRQTIETPLTAEQIKTLRRVARLITKGSKEQKQTQGRYFGKAGGFEIENHCCTLGACLIAVGAPKSNSVVITDYLPVNEWPKINYPEGVSAWGSWNKSINPGAEHMHTFPIPLADVIMQLNDVAKWSFDQIVSYLRAVAKKGVVISITA